MITATDPDDRIICERMSCKLTMRDCLHRRSNRDTCDGCRKCSDGEWYQIMFGEECGTAGMPKQTQAATRIGTYKEGLGSEHSHITLKRRVRQWMSDNGVSTRQFTDYFGHDRRILYSNRWTQGTGIAIKNRLAELEGSNEQSA